MISGAAKGDKVTRPPLAGHRQPTTNYRKGCSTMSNEQYFKLEELKHKYNEKLMEAQKAHDEQEETYFSGVLNGIQIAARELLSE
jgi:hypothetical protein